MAKAKFIKDLKSTPPIKDSRKVLTGLVKGKASIVITCLDDVMISISRVHYQLQEGTIDIPKAKAILHADNIFIQAYREAKLEKQLDELEEKLSGII